MIDLSIFTEKHHVMDPVTEDLIPTGNELKDGMLVLCEDPSYRTDPREIEYKSHVSEDMILDSEKWAIGLRWNRWATVSHVNVYREAYIEAKVSFVATYEDGTKRKLEAPVSTGWYVKLYSLPQETNEENPNATKC